ncbi:unnamed protein product [Rhizopus stolonifer]
MSSKAFEKLLYKSHSLTGVNKKNDFAPVELNLAQLADQSAFFFSKVDNEQRRVEPSTHYFLAQRRINMREMQNTLKKLDSTVIFEPSDMIKSTDIDSYLRQKRESLVKEKDTTAKESVELLDSPTRSDRKQLTSDCFVLIDQLKQFSHLKHLSQAQKDSANDACELINHLVNYSRESKRECISKSSQRQEFIWASKNWLEKRYQQNIANIMFKYATKIQVGGIPSPKHRILAYIRFMYKRSDMGWTEPDLELQHDVPIWLYLYLLLRNGLDALVLDFVEVEGEALQSSPGFSAFMKEFLQSPRRLLSEESRKKVLSEYQQMEYGIEKYDPYKKLLYKIMGRCEMNKPVETFNKEDQLWLQLSLVREQEEDLMYGNTDFGIIDLQNLLNANEHEIQNTNNSWDQFTVLLLSLQFEKAIDYLHGFEAFKLNNKVQGEKNIAQFPGYTQ